ncbi:hypothetical protein [Kitasatospora sp. NBC_00315]|uniref:hypothetical protein n=1 Tax=Kitasatospora sp. NBC_00315 TaxID=2975963 RepID=UPI003248B9B0
MNTVQELRAALRAGHGFPGDAERLAAEQLLRRVPADWLDQADRVGTVVDLVTVAEIVTAYRGRVLLSADSETADAVDQRAGADGEADRSAAE